MANCSNQPACKSLDSCRKNAPGSRVDQSNGVRAHEFVLDAMRGVLLDVLADQPKVLDFLLSTMRSLYLHNVTFEELEQVYSISAEYVRNANST